MNGPAMNSPARPALLALLLASAASPAAANRLLPNSVVSNDLDFILPTDPGPGWCLRYKGTATAEMPDRRHDTLMADNVHVFEAAYGDGSRVGLFVHPDVGTRAEAEALSAPVLDAVGRLPPQMRGLLSHVNINDGNEPAFSEDLGRFVVLYSDNILSRISTNDLQETVFHESVNATIDEPHAASASWRAAQAADGGFVTEYAAEKPEGEDMAESALFAWAMLKHPGRLPAGVEDAVRAVMPNRLAWFENHFAGWGNPATPQPAPSC